MRLDLEVSLGHTPASEFIRRGSFPAERAIGETRESPQLAEIPAQPTSRQPSRSPQGPRLHHQQDAEALQGEAGLSPPPDRGDGGSGGRLAAVNASATVLAALAAAVLAAWPAGAEDPPP